jgi:hypothetical protein
LILFGKIWDNGRMSEGKFVAGENGLKNSPIWSDLSMVS